jgi:hypothetical protein
MSGVADVAFIVTAMIPEADLLSWLEMRQNLCERPRVQESIVELLALRG